VAAPSLFQTYVDRLRTHAFCLIAEGYSRMDKSSFVSEEEPAITGELVREMRVFLESDEAPSWACFYAIHDDPPLSVGNKLGKSRHRVDIEFERVIAGPRPRLRFEAKRLDTRTRHTVSDYLGNEGLGCFTSGRYPANHGEAGMLGYVQSENEETWADRIATALGKNKEKYMAIDPPFSQQILTISLPHIYLSHHSAKKPPNNASIYHVLLRFN
jgi:hypothetical protein